MQEENYQMPKRRRWIIVATLCCGFAAFILTVLGAFAPADVSAEDMVSIPTVPTIPTIPPTPDCSTPTITSVRSGNWDDPSTWDAHRVPGSSDIVLVELGHHIQQVRYVNIFALCNEGLMSSRLGSWMYMRARGFVDNQGTIRGLDGLFDTRYCSRGTSIYIATASFRNDGAMLAGDGTSNVRCGGGGGNIYIRPYRYYDGAEIINRGLLQAGDAGSLTGLFYGRAGRGGSIWLWAGWFGTVWDEGVQIAGNGGNGNRIAFYPQHGGDGGCNRVWAGRIYMTGVSIRAGMGGRGTGGGRNGLRGCIRIDPPNEIVISGPGTAIEGGEVEIFGGADWDLRLTDLPSKSITGTTSIKLAVGPGGTIDMRNTAAETLVSFGDVIVAADTISVTSGVVISDLIDAPDISLEPGALQYNVELVGQDQHIDEPLAQVALTIGVLNGSLVTETFNLTVGDEYGWTHTSLPASVTLPPLEGTDLTFTVTMPFGSPTTQTNVFTVTATSQTDPTTVESHTIDMIVDEDPQQEGMWLYLPIMTIP